jgi:sugar phosphate isomerase/epimerase
VSTNTANTTLAGLADRVGISSITFRFRPLDEALRLIADTGATEIDLGAIPAVTDHVPVPFTGDPQTYVDLLARYGLRSGAVNSDVGDLNDPALTGDALAEIAEPLIDLAAATGWALIVPCGRASWEPIVDDAADLALIAENLRFLGDLCAAKDVRLLVEVLHHKRYIHSVARAEELLALVDGDVFGLLFDVSHIVASGDDPVAWARTRADRIERVHLRDAVPGNLNVGIGRGDADFAGVIDALEAEGFTGTYILELETHDVEEHEREADALRSRNEIIHLLENANQTPKEVRR